MVSIAVAQLQMQAALGADEFDRSLLYDRDVAQTRGTSSWVIGGAVVLIASAAAYQASSGSPGIQTVLALALGLIVIGASIAFSFWVSRRVYEDREQLIRRVDRALHEFAERGGHAFTPGGSSDYPGVPTMTIPGRVQWTRDSLSFRIFLSECDEEQELVVAVGPVPANRERLTGRTKMLSPRARKLVRDLVGGRASVAVDAGGQLTVRFRGDLVHFLDRDGLPALVDRTAALAEDLRAP
jgi:hypothetical protein